MVIVKELIYEDDFLISEEKRIALKLIKWSAHSHNRNYLAYAPGFNPTMSVIISECKLQNASGFSPK
jgi:hypothetical protein